ncbi:hypothetical protein Btru_005233 [Bulinus truncatus]|nr:hypothetical protein Btru_005233 [Bulinus truncatus]
MSQGNTNASGNHSNRNSPPHLPPESPGSSVSSYLQNEYAELLKYAVGFPSADLASTSNQIPDNPKVFQPIILTRSQGSSARQTPVYEHEGGHLSDVNTNSLYPDEDKLSQCEDEDQNSNKGKKCIKSKMVKTKVSAVSDQAVQEMSGKLDGWLGKLKRDILEQLCCSMNNSATCIQKLYQKEKEDLNKEKECLQKEINKFSEMLCTMEQSLCRKDTLIENLTTALAKEKEKLTKAQAFYACKTEAKEKKREKFTEKLAANFHNNQLTKKVMKNWFGLIQQKWKERTERLCEAKAKNVCSELCTDYEEKIKTLNQHIACLEMKLQTLQCEQEEYAQQMKKAFMRGVCALNMEAMTAFGQDEACKPADVNMCQNTNGSTSHNLDFLQPYKSDHFGKSLPPELTKAAGFDRPAQSLTTFAFGSEQKSQTSGALRSKSLSTGPRQPPSQGFTLAPPMASVVVERHDPITKQTIGKATAVRYPKKNKKEERLQKTLGSTYVSKSQPFSSFKPLAVLIFRN